MVDLTPVGAIFENMVGPMHDAMRVAQQQKAQDAGAEFSATVKDALKGLKLGSMSFAGDAEPGEIAPQQNNEQSAQLRRDAAIDNHDIGELMDKPNLESALKGIKLEGVNFAGDTKPGDITPQRDTREKAGAMGIEPPPSNKEAEEFRRALKAEQSGRGPK